MQFINIVVHSVEEMNFRSYLQYEFTALGLDEYLEVSLPTIPSTSFISNSTTHIFNSKFYHRFIIYAIQVSILCVNEKQEIYF